MEPVEGVPVLIKIKEAPGVFGNTFVSKNSLPVYTDSRGHFEIAVPQRTIIVLSIDSVGIKKSLVIPCSTHADIKDLLSMTQNI